MTRDLLAVANLLVVILFQFQDILDRAHTSAKWRQYGDWNRLDGWLRFNGIFRI